MTQRKFVPTSPSRVEPVLGARLIGLEAFEELGELIVAERVAEGLDPQVVDQLAASLAVPRSELLEAVGLRLGVLHYRRSKGLPLGRGVSDRLYRVARAGAAALNFFEGEVEPVGRWLLSPKVGLGDRIPLVMACTPEGSAHVVAMLSQAEQGVIS